MAIIAVMTPATAAMLSLFARQSYLVVTPLITHEPEDLLPLTHVHVPPRPQAVATRPTAA